ncbi:MAG: Uma2 family endonuclease [Candidatus Latescibacteria bacterium]|nr:Uma2 family endonuclease [Candidatus Latescibacterota bacterium]
MNLTPPDSFGFEILRGELIVAPAPRPKHQWVCDELTSLIRAFVKQKDLGRVFSSPIDVILGGEAESENVVQPDLLFVAKDRLDIITETNVLGAPDLMVEILSPSSIRRDRADKMKLYAEFGVVEYWIIDADQKILEAFDLTGDMPVLLATLAESDVFHPGLFPGLVIALSELWYPETNDSDEKDT